MKPLRSLLALGLMVATLSGCQKGEARDGITARSTAVIVSGGERITQTNVVRCRYVGMNDGVVHIGTAPIVEGDHHWVRRADGSVVVFPRFNACLTPEVPIGGSKDVTGEFDWWSGDHVRLTYVFDSADRPTKVDLYTQAAATDGHRDPHVESVTLGRVEGEVTHKLAQGFPGLAGIIPDPKRMALNGLGGNLIAGSFVGVQATSYVLAAGTSCQTNATDGLVLLPKGDGCQFINDCDKGNATTVCGQRKGGLRVALDSKFSDATAVVGTADKEFSATLYDARLPVFRNAPSVRRGDYRKWTPRVCVKTLCKTLEEQSSSALFYFPKTRELIEIGPVMKSFGPSMFSGWRGP